MEEKKYVLSQEEVVDMAWKAEGLDKFLEEKGQRVELRDLRKALDIVLLPPNKGVNPRNDEIVGAYRVIETLTNNYKYDSGKRR